MPKIDVTEFGDVIRERLDEAKRKRGDKLYEIADACQMTKQHLLNIVNGKVAVRVDDLFLLSQKLEHNLFTYFVDETDLESMKDERNREVDDLKKKYKQAEKEITYLKEINSLQKHMIEGRKTG